MKLQRYTVTNPPQISEQEKNQNLAEAGIDLYTMEKGWWNFFDDASTRLLEAIYTGAVDDDDF